MFMRKFLTAVVMALAFGSTDASAATVSREVYTFDATLTQGTVLCGEFVGLEAPCPANFGTYSGTPGDDLMFGLAIGNTYSGQVVLESEGGALVSASCELNGGDCLFSTDLIVAPLPLGPVASVDFSNTSVVGSRFEFNGATGSYFFGTDYTFDADGVHYYASVRFDLASVNHSISEVPLPASAGLLLIALGGIGAITRSRRRVV